MNHYRGDILKFQISIQSTNIYIYIHIYIYIYKYKVSKTYNYKDVKRFIIEYMRSVNITQISFTEPPSCYAML